MLAYNLLLMTACQFVAMEDDLEGALALRIDNTETYANYREREDLPGMAELGAAMHDLMGDPDLAAGYYASCMTTRSRFSTDSPTGSENFANRTARADSDLTVLRRTVSVRRRLVR